MKGKRRAPGRLERALLAGWCLAALSTGPAGAAEPQIRSRPLPGARAEAATLIVQGIEGGSLPFAAVALTEAARTAPGADGSATVRLPILFEVPRAALDAPTLELYAYAMTAPGAVAAHLAAALDLEPGRPPAGAGAKLIATLDLPPATYSLRFLILEPASHRFALRRAEVTLPAAGSATALTRPALDEPCDDWAVASTPEAPSSTASALPVLPTGSRIELSSSLLGRDAEADDDAMTATVRLEPDRAAASMAHAFRAELSGGERGAAGGRSLGIAFDLPAIARGVYRLRVEVGRPGGPLVSPATEVWVVDAGDLGAEPADPCARTWSAVAAHSADRAGSPHAAPLDAAAAATSRSGKRAELERKQAYREVLHELAATSDLDSASEALRGLEERLPNVLSGLQALLRNQLDVARRLAAREPEIVPLLMMLHHQAYLAHSRRGQFALAGHSTRVVQALAELMVKGRQREENLALAAGILTSLAEHGHRSRMFVPGRLLLEDALEMDPGNPEALLLLAVSHEWFGRYEEAGGVLERLVRAQAANSEARLRLGFVRLRTGDAARAEQDFRRILREGAPAWQLSLAYQGLAELMREQERHGEAVDLLAEGRSRLGADQRLYLLGAHALDRAGRPGEARRLLDALPIDGSMGTPRFRYGESLTSPLVALREAIARGVAVRLPLLARALEREPPG